MLKKIINLAFVLIFFTQFVIIADDRDPVANLQMQKIFYSQVSNMKERSEKMRDIYKVSTNEYESFVLGIIIDVANYFLKNDVMETKYFEEWAYYAVLTAAKLKIKDSAQYMRDIYSKVKKAEYKASILYSIAVTENRDFIPFFNSQLKFFNDKKRIGDTDIKDMYIIVEACVRGISLYADKSSFYELFYTSMFYNEKINNLAAETLIKISNNDASELCDNIIKNSEDFSIVYEAIKYAYSSNSANEKKIVNCKTALSRMLYSLTAADMAKKEMIVKIKNKSVEYLGLLKATDSDSIKMIETKWEYDIDEMSDFTTIQALERIGTAEAAQVLVTRLALYIKRLKEGAKAGIVKEDGVKLMTEMVKAIGNIGSFEAIKELEAIRTGPEFGKPIQNEADKAIKKILSRK